MDEAKSEAEKLQAKRADDEALASATRGLQDLAKASAAAGDSQVTIIETQSGALEPEVKKRVQPPQPEAGGGAEPQAKAKSQPKRQAKAKAKQAAKSTEGKQDKDDAAGDDGMEPIEPRELFPEDGKHRKRGVATPQQASAQAKPKAKAKTQPKAKAKAKAKAEKSPTNKADEFMNRGCTVDLATPASSQCKKASTSEDAKMEHAEPEPEKKRKERTPEEKAMHARKERFYRTLVSQNLTSRA